MSQYSATEGVINTQESQTRKDEALLELMRRTGYQLVQQNGQRKYGGPPPDWEGEPPLKGSEVFVGKIPRDCYEDELVPIFELVGKIYELRLMMDFSGSNRGYAFVMYTNANDAKNAVKQLDNYEIRKGRYLGVCKSVDNCRLFVGGIPKTKLREEVLDEMAKVSDGVVNVILYSSIMDKTKSRGFAFIEYESHRLAAMARRKLIPGKIQLWGQDIAVDWAEPEPEVDEEIMSRVTILYVRNLMLTTTEDKIKEMFSINGTVVVEKVKKLRDFAFVHYKNREDAERAKNEFHHKIIDDSEIEVTWAKPVDKTMKNKAYAGKLANPEQYQSYNGQFTDWPPFTQCMYSPVAHQPALNVDPNVTQMVTYAPAPTYTSFNSGRGGSSGGRHVVSRGRGRGAAGYRGTQCTSYNVGRGGSFRKPSEIRLFSVQPGMELIPTNPFTLKPNKSPTQILHEMAQKNNWGETIYQLHSVVHRDQSNGEDIQLFLYKVTFPNLPTVFTPTKLSTNTEEAKQLAAEFVLMQFGVSVEAYEQGFFDTTPSQTMPVMPTIRLC